MRSAGRVRSPTKPAGGGPRGGRGGGRGRGGGGGGLGAGGATAPMGTARIPRMITASARAGFVTRIPLPTLPFIIVLPISGRSQADHTRMAAARLKERPYRTGGRGSRGRVSSAVAL